MHASSMVVATIHGSEYLLGNPAPSESRSLEFFKQFLPERKRSLVSQFNGVQTQVIAYREDEGSE